MFKTNDHFELDPQFIEEIEKDWTRLESQDVVALRDVDVSVLFEPVQIVPTREGTRYPEKKLEQLLARTYKMPTLQSSPAAKDDAPYKTTSQQLLEATISEEDTSAAHIIAKANIASKLAESLLKQDSHLIDVINAISSPDIDKARAAITEIGEILESPEKQTVLLDYEEIFIQNVLKQLKNLSSVTKEVSHMVYPPLLTILYGFFDSKILGKRLGRACIKNMMSVLLDQMGDQKLNNTDEQEYKKVMNGICLKALNEVNFTNLNCALICLLRETCLDTELFKFTDLLMKCMWRNVKMFPQRSNELDYEEIILEIHEFMVRLPSASWKFQPSDTPLRTVKSILHNLTKLKGNAILRYLNAIPSNSELHTYFIKILKNLHKEGHLTNGLPKSSETSRDVPSLLCAEEMQNWKIDVANFVRDNPQLHQCVEDGLAEIERALNCSAAHIQNCHTKSEFSLRNHYPKEMNSEVDLVDKIDDFISIEDINPQYWMDRLQFLRSKASLPPLEDHTGSLMSLRFIDKKISGDNSSGNPKSSSNLTLSGDTFSYRLQHLETESSKSYNATL